MFLIKKSSYKKKKDENEGGEENTLKTKHALFWMDMKKDSFKHNHTWTEIFTGKFWIVSPYKKISVNT